MPGNQITIPQPGTANNAPDTDGTPAPYQAGSTLVPNPGKADGKLGTGSNLNFIPGTTQVPNSSKADGMGGKGSNLLFIPESDPVPNPGKTDGKLGTGSFASGIPYGATAIVPNPNKADGVDDGGLPPPTPPTPPPTNLIPQGATYSNQATYTYTAATVGLTYAVIFGANEVDAEMDPHGFFGGPYDISNDTPFQYVGGFITFDGQNPSTPVTAQLFLE